MLVWSDVFCGGHGGTGTEAVGGRDFGGSALMLLGLRCVLTWPGNDVRLRVRCAVGRLGGVLGRVGVAAGMSQGGRQGGWHGGRGEFDGQVRRGDGYCVLAFAVWVKRGAGACWCGAAGRPVGWAAVGGV